MTNMNNNNLLATQSLTVCLELPIMIGNSDSLLGAAYHDFATVKSRLRCGTLTHCVRKQNLIEISQTGVHSHKPYNGAQCADTCMKWS